MLNPTFFPRWTAALGKVLNGQGDARVLCIGDSTTWGAYGAGYPSNSTSLAYPALLSKLIGLPASNGAACVNSTTAPDSRIVLTGSWIVSNNGAGFANQSWFANASGTYTFTPGDGQTYDRFDVYAAGGSSGGALTATATGGSATPLNYVGKQITKTTVNCGSASASNSITISWVSGQANIFVIEAWNSSANRIRFTNAGLSGSIAAPWANLFTSQATIQNYAPDLSFIMLGINDAQALIKPATYLSNIQSILNACRISGDVILLSPIPSDPSLALTVSLESQYAAGLAQLAQYNAVRFIDIFNGLFGGFFQSTIMANTLHPNASGYFMIADYINNLGVIK